MADVNRWVLVNREAHTIIDGAFLWDGETPWEPGESPDMILEADALAEGYTWDLPEDPVFPDPDPTPPQEPVYD